MERTLIILKPDTVQRALVGDILMRFERAGLKMVGMKMMMPSDQLLADHYPDDMVPIVGNKTKADWNNYGIEHTESAEEIGEMIVRETRNFMKSVPLLPPLLSLAHFS